MLVFCNKCYDSKEDKQQTFFVTSCFHVFCESCFKNFGKKCLLCKNECKILPINDELSQEVKDFFDPNSISRMVQKIERISTFCDAQTKLYLDNNYHHRSDYFKSKNSFLKLKECNAEIDAAMKREKSIIAKLKDAYHSKVINPSVFQLRSPPLDSKITAAFSDFHADQQQLEEPPSKLRKLEMIVKSGLRTKVRNNNVSRRLQ